MAGVKEKGLSMVLQGRKTVYNSPRRFPKERT
jgi:hypothetical protein